MKRTDLWRIAACAAVVAWLGGARADSYKWLCSRCGGTWWTGSPLDNSCPRCPSRTYGKQVEHKSDATSSLSSPSWSSSGPSTGQMLREMRKSANERRQNFSNFMNGLAEKRMARRNELMQRAGSSNFNLGTALASDYPSLPPAVQAGFQDERARKLLEPQVLMEQLADKQEATYTSILKMIGDLQGPNAEQALASFWNGYAHFVRSMGPSLEDRLEGSKWLYVGFFAVRPFDAQYKSHADAIQEILRQKVRGMGMNPDRGPFDPQKHLTPAQQRLRAEILGRGGMNPQNTAPQRQAPWAGGARQQPGLVLPTQMSGGAAGMAAGEVVTEAAIERHLAGRKETIDRLIAAMAPETFQNARNAALQTLTSFIGRQSGTLVSQAEIDSFWSNQMWRTGNRQDLLAMAYYAVCVMSFVDPAADAKLGQKAREVDGAAR